MTRDSTSGNTQYSKTLADSPAPLWELGWPEARSRQRVAAVCGPDLVSLEARGLIEVRRFESWPEPWERADLSSATSFSPKVNASNDGPETPLELTWQARSPKPAGDICSHRCSNR